MKRMTPVSGIRILDPYILPYLRRNADTILIKEWQQMDERGFLDNFKITGMNAFGFYRGPLDADACVHDWAKAVITVLSGNKDNDASATTLNYHLEEYIRLVTAAQDESGYLYTYKQICEPSKRWNRLYTEREWFCMGAFIETAVTGYRLAGKTDLLHAAEKCADLFLNEFGASEDSRVASFTRIERAFFLLSSVTGNERYAFAARQWLERRPRQKHPGLKLLRQAKQLKKAEKEILKNQQTLLNHKYPVLGSRWEIFAQDKKHNRLKTLFSLATGDVLQLHRRKSVFDVPHGSAENYIALLRAWLADPASDTEVLSAVEKQWNEMVLHYSYITGGTGSNALTGSFGQPDDLPQHLSCASPEAACEMLLLSHELYQRTGRLFYIDFYEWIFYNLILTTINSDRDRFFSRHLHESTGDWGRRESPVHMAAPLSVSTAFAFYQESLLFTDEENGLYIDQYISLEAELENPKLSISMTTSEADSFRTEIRIVKKTSDDITLFLRIPGWAMGYRIVQNGQELDSMPNILYSEIDPIPHYFNGNRFPVTLSGQNHFTITVDFPKIVRSHYVNRRKKHKNKRADELFAVSRGKFLYCAEETDNRHVDFDRLNLNALTDFKVEKSYDFFSSLIIEASDIDSNRIRLIPFHLWNNRGNGKMKIWLENKTKETK